jgi:hypothetical protein
VLAPPVLLEVGAREVGLAAQDERQSNHSVTSSIAPFGDAGRAIQLAVSAFILPNGAPRGRLGFAPAR